MKLYKRVTARCSLSDQTVPGHLAQCRLSISWGAISISFLNGDCSRQHDPRRLGLTVRRLHYPGSGIVLPHQPLTLTVNNFFPDHSAGNFRLVCATCTMCQRNRQRLMVNQSEGRAWQQYAVHTVHISRGRARGLSISGHSPADVGLKTELSVGLISIKL